MRLRRPPYQQKCGGYAHRSGCRCYTRSALISQQPRQRHWRNYGVQPAYGRHRPILPVNVGCCTASKGTSAARCAESAFASLAVLPPWFR